ncbi:polysaccharide deacetylase family protein [Psychroflexus sp. ALD_RP9]|uniref:polysaccharide deacetylase family protein n=1 Tax=Psychroflexus sp. ALD_RP9 TaxID=2777186 RepID=UPI001A8CADFF|nr:polysaccharide deacetylase family protein [Psychroflexus sp. ALD_RP9]QSS96352.1 polysaccharide deacetylase family protein [Psychroflexus sp. ALD_RP9]
MLKSSWFYNLLYPKRLWRFTDNNIYLTFDDGPIPEVTPWVLKQLKQFKAKATFFCIGDNIKKHPEIFLQIINEGHSIGNHSMQHLNGWKTNTEDYIEDINNCQQIIKQLSKETCLFRPPYGKCTSKQAKILHQKGFKIVMWDVITKDYDMRKSPQECFKIYKSQVRNGSIIVMHDSQKAFKNLHYILPKILKEKYHFKAI